MDIRVLGPIEVELGRRPLGLGGPKQRAVLSLLALNANATVSVDRLIEGLWGEEQPASAAKMVQLYVSQLRKLLDEDDGSEILTHGRGYELRLDPEAVDAARFERLVADASRGRGDGGAGEAARGALALWRGPPFADLADEPFAAAEARRLEELHLVAFELAIESDLEAGSHRQLIGRLEALVAEHPLRERLHGLRMLALYRAGRQAEALDAYHAARGTLVEQIGVEPGPELRRLHEAILRQDPELDLDVPTADWARRETVDRVGEGAERAAARRGELRELEAGLASDVVDLHELRERAELDPATPGREPHAGDEAGTPVCPFKGLASFDVADADYFFGRERLVAEIVARLVGTTLLGVVGPSGSGKSSTMRAGLLPALASGVLPGSEAWTRVLLRPGEHPLSNLRRALGAADESDDPISAALSRLQPEAKLLLAVDQFEETFAACRGELERAAFMDALADAARRSDGRVVIVLALRADYYGACAAHPRLSRLLGDNQVLVGPMQPDELARAIEGPARRAGLVVEPELVERLVEDVAGEAGGLPLLSTALLELWRRREGRRMRLAAYERTGGVRGAVARLAEQAYATLTADEQLVARRVLLRLAGSGEGDGVVRRRVPLAELEAGRDEQAGRVLEVLTDSRLVTVGEGTAEVAHEALLREWPRLRGWLEEDAEGRRLHRHITDAARDWDTGGRDAGELYRGARLASTLDWAAEHGDELNRLEREFLQDSRLVSEREAAHGRQVNRRLRTLLAGALATLVIAIVAGVVALDQRGDARDEAVAAEAQRLGSRALVEDDLDRSLLLARQGVALDDTVQTRGNLLATLLKSPAALGVLRGDGESLTTSELSPDQRTLAAGDTGTKVFLFDTRTRRRIRVLEPAHFRAYVADLAFSPDGRRLAVGYDVETYGNLVAVLDVRSGRVVARMRPPRDRYVSGMRYSSDGRTLDVVASLFEGDGPAVLVRFDAQTGRRLLGPVPVNRRGTSPMLTNDGRRIVAAGEGETTLRDAASLRVLRSYPVGGNSHALSSDDRTVALGGEDGSVRFLDLRSGRVRTAPDRHGAAIDAVRFTPDGRTLTSTGEDGDVVLWDVRNATAGERLSGHAGAIVSAEITRDGRTLYTSSADATVLIWDLAGARRFGRPFRAGAGNAERPHLALSSDGRLIATGQDDGAISVVDARTLDPREPVQILPPGRQVLGIGFVPGGHRMVVGGPEGFLALVDADRGQVVRRMRGHRGNIWTPGISANGRLLATGSDDNTVRLWTLPDGRPSGAPLRFRRRVDDAQLSPDGRWLTIALGDEFYDKGSVEIWDVRTRRRVRSLPVPENPGFVRFSPDGRLLVMGYRRGLSHVWSTSTWKPVTRLLAGDAGAIAQAAISSDGRTLATGSIEGTVRLWDIETEQAVGAPLPGPHGEGAIPYFTPDGTRLIASYTGGRAYAWDIRAESLARHACQVAGRRLTRAEWAEFLPGRGYDPAC